jgi:hypothetical protein
MLLSLYDDPKRRRLPGFNERRMREWIKRHFDAKDWQIEEIMPWCRARYESHGLQPKDWPWNMLTRWGGPMPLSGVMHSRTTKQWKLKRGWTEERERKHAFPIRAIDDSSVIEWGANDGERSWPSVLAKRGL